ncbi:ESX secretion-associated protein EspG [Kibdelosporangium lantanae]
MTVLSTVEFEVCWAVLGLGELPLVLDLPSAGRTDDERRTVVGRALADLAARDLADRDGPRPQLARYLGILAGYAWAVDTRIISTTRVRARGASDGRVGVLAVHEDERVTIRPVPEGVVVAEVMALAGEAPSTGRPDSASVRASALDAVAGVEPRRLAEALTAHGERPRDAGLIARMCQGAHTRGQFSTPRGSSRVVAFHDTPSGRYLQLRRDGWVTFASAANGRMAAQINDLVVESR